MPTPEQLERMAFTGVKDGSPLHQLVTEHRQKPAPDSRDWWQEVAQGLGVKTFELKAQRDELLTALKAARDVLVGYQKHAGYLPEQGGYSTRMSDAERQLAQAASDLDSIITKAEGR